METEGLGDFRPPEWLQLSGKHWIMLSLSKAEHIVHEQHRLWYRHNTLLIVLIVLAPQASFLQL